MIDKLKDNKAFTIIELLVVLVIIAILVLLALPNLLGNTEKAKLAQIKNDIKVYEDVIGSERITNDDFIEGWETFEKVDLLDLIDSNSLLSKKGLVKSRATLNEELYYSIPEDLGLIKTSLKLNSFYMSEGGSVYYHDDRFRGNASSGNDDEAKLEPAPEEDFIDLYDYDHYEAREPGKYYHYIGNDEVVVIPNEIDGNKITTYDFMFMDIPRHLEINPEEAKSFGGGNIQSGQKVYKVIDLEESNDIEKTVALMFGSRDVDQLDLSELNNNYIFAEMFVESKVGHLKMFDINNKHIGRALFAAEIGTLDFSGHDFYGNVDISEIFYSDAPARITESIDFSNTSFSNIDNLRILESRSVHLNEDVDINFSNSTFSNIGEMSDFISANASINSLNFENTKFNENTVFAGLTEGLVLNDLYLTNVDLSKSESGLNGIYSNRVHWNGLKLNDNVSRFGIFHYMDAGTNMDFSELNIDNLTNMDSIFSNTKLRKIDFSNANLRNIRSMNGTFSSSEFYEVDMSGLDLTNVKTMDKMFWGSIGDKVDMSGVDFSSVDNFNQMFYQSSIRELDISGFTASDAAGSSFSNMFSYFDGTVYVRTQDEIDFFNTHAGTDGGAKFQIK